jgi:hypothetical protein
MKRYKISLIGFLIIVPDLLIAQGGMADSIKTQYDTISYWTRTAEVAATFKQIGLKNWVQGGQGIIGSWKTTGIFQQDYI